MAIPTRNSDPSNIIAGERTFFITSSIAGKRNLLQSDRSARLFVLVIYEYRAQGKFQLHDFVVMPDHFHVLLTLRRDISVERAVQFIKGGFAYRAGKEVGLTSPVWQKGFSEIRIKDEIAFERARNYIRNNPVAKHLAPTAEEFPYSSAHPGFELDAMPDGLKPVSTDLYPVGMAKAMP
jgi:putative transposase